MQRRMFQTFPLWKLRERKLNRSNGMDIWMIYACHYVELWDEQYRICFKISALIFETFSVREMQHH